jgi:GTP-sensing pleiotropic transcriptional regulator CodY
MMPGKDRDASGKYTTSYSDDAFLAAVAELGPEVGTQAISEKVGCGRDTAYRRLRSLEEAGEIRSRKVGMARLWSIAD